MGGQLKKYTYFFHPPLEDKAAKLTLTKSIWGVFQSFVVYNPKSVS